MPIWSEPQDFKTCLTQSISLRGTVLLLTVVAIFISEVRFSWIEILVGRYLVVTNAHRPESGNVWEQGRLKQVATQNLEQMITEQLTAQREAHESTSLPQLLEGLSASQGTIISASHFKRLYSQVPENTARVLFSPYFMLRISAEGSWERVYLERESDQIGIYLLDRSNNVLSYTTLPDSQIGATGGEVTVVDGSLNDMAEFRGRIYPADRFFMALDTLPPETQQAILSRPEALLSTEGSPIQVGISDEVNADRIRIAIEMKTDEGRRIYLDSGLEWAVWQVRSLLDPRLTPSTPSQGRSKNWPRARHGGGDR